MSHHHLRAFQNSWKNISRAWVGKGMSDHFRAFQNSFRNISYHGDISDRLESHFIKVDRIYQSTGRHVRSFDIPFECNSYNFKARLKILVELQVRALCKGCPTSYTILLAF